MICKECAWEADLLPPDINGDRAEIVSWDGEAKPAMLIWPRKVLKKVERGHSVCKGGSWCDCMHKEPGAWNGGR